MSLLFEGQDGWEVRHVVALSGGKDSTALALRLAEVEPRDYDYLITPTGNELPEMVAHWERLEGLLGKKLTRVTVHNRTLTDLIQIHNALPSNAMRWCTRQLKIEPAIAWCIRNAPVTLYVGLRADEEGRPGIMGDRVTCDFPLRRWGWTKTDVLAYLRSRNVEIPTRTDCAFCYDQRLIEWWRLWKDHRDLWAEAKAHESLVGSTFRSPSRDTWPASLAEMEKRFEAGVIPKTRKEPETKCRVCSL